MKTDLTYLREMAAGNSDLVIEMINLFKTQVEEFKIIMQQQLESKEYILLGKTAHKAKASVSIMGLNDLSRELKQLEINTKEDKAIETYPAVVDRFIKECNEVLDELDEVVKNIQLYF
jgi:HPt (histidine-containing phosphotransfer) domain-containing protein